MSKFRSFRQFLFLILACFLSFEILAEASFTITAQQIEDVYVDSTGNLAFGVKLIGKIRAPDSHEPYVGINEAQVLTEAQLEGLCVWQQPGTEVNGLRFRYTGVENKKNVLSLLLRARVKGQPLSITYTPITQACEPAREDCPCLLPELAQATSVSE